MDLRWRMFGVPVRVHPFFWIISAVFGWGITDDPDLDGRMRMLYLLVWVLCVFVSVLIHELGHVLFFRLFGARAHVVLHGFGGLAIPDRMARWGWQRFLISFAGPLAQFALLGVVILNQVFLLPRVSAQSGEFLERVLLYLFFINLFWPLLNLLPIWPLDGGQMTREVFRGVFRDWGVYASLILSVAVAGLLAAHCIMGAFHKTLLPYVPHLGMYSAVFFAYLCVNNFQALQAESAARRRRYDYDYDDHDKFPWER
jgi:Zn-dependent protease